jgi:Ca2+-binding RTX toxin-like protein
MPTQFEPLEPRTHLSISSAGGVLTIVGSRRSNLITIQFTAPALLNVRENDTLRIFSAPSLRRIVIRGAAGADRIDCAGVPVPLTVTAGNGNDTLNGGEANDRLFGEAGDDQIVGNLGGDAISGGAGSDATLFDDRRRPLVITVGDGRANDGETLTDSLGRLVSEGDDVRGDVEIIVGGSDDDFIAGDALANTLFGGDGDDTLRGGRGNDVLVGEIGSDLLLGDDGNDVFMAGEGSGVDTLNGGRGFDIAQRDILVDRLFKIEFTSDVQTNF